MRCLRLTASGDWYQPPASATWQLQLQGSLNTTYDVDIFDIDLFDSSSDQITQLQSNGSRVICYFSAGSHEDWREDAGDFASEDLGNAVNEQCFEYAECDTLLPFISSGKPVLNVEYRAEYVNNQVTRNTMCEQSLSLQFSTLVLPLDLDDQFRFSCMKINGVSID